MASFLSTIKVTSRSTEIISIITKYYLFFALLFMQLRDSFGAEIDCTGRVIPALHEGVFRE